MPLLIPSIIGLLVGVALLTRGLRGRRVGDEPHCRCGYLLHGLESKVCPECGQDITPRNIRYGTCRRIRWQIITAALCLAVALTGLSLHLTGVAQRIDWYRLAPMSWLASAAESGNRNALAEIDRRLGAPKVHANDFRAAVDAGLRVQKNRPPTADLQAWLNLLSKLESTGCMTPADRVAFFSRIVELSLVARSKLRQGDLLAYRVEAVIRAPNTGPFGRSLVYNNAMIGDQIVSVGGPYSDYFNNSTILLNTLRSSSHSVRTSRIAVGQTTLKVNVSIGIQAIGVCARMAPSIWSARIQLSSPLTVVSADAKDSIRSRIGDVDRSQWKTVLSVKKVSCYSIVGSSNLSTLIEVGVMPTVPYPACFEVWLKCDGRNERLSTFSTRAPDIFRHPRRSTNMWWSVVSGTTELPLRDHPFRIILRGSRDVALNEPEVVEYYDGEIDLGEYRLAPDFADPTRWTSAPTESE